MPTIIATADPDFAQLAAEELASEQVAIQQQPRPGLFLADYADGFFGLAQQWEKAPPTFVRHICPVQTAVSITHAESDVPLLLEQIKAEYSDLFEPTLRFSIQTRLLADVDYKPFLINRTLSDAIAQQTGATLDVRQPEQILSVTILPQVAYVGLSLTQHNLSAWPGGAHRFARQKGQISRAEFKLLEAIDLFNIPLPPRGTALDLGAAPGGWTRILRQHDQFVTAVDPGRLHRSLSNDRMVRHKWMTAEDYLADDPDRFDLIVNDMRLDARDSARLMNDFAPHIYRNGRALMTLKLPENGRHPVIDHACNILREKYEILRLRHLFHNRSELSAYLLPKSNLT